MIENNEHYSDCSEALDVVPMLGRWETRQTATAARSLAVAQTHTQTRQLRGRHPQDLEAARRDEAGAPARVLFAASLSFRLLLQHHGQHNAESPNLKSSVFPERSKTASMSSALRSAVVKRREQLRTLSKRTLLR